MRFWRDHDQAKNITAASRTQTLELSQKLLFVLHNMKPVVGWSEEVEERDSMRNRCFAEMSAVNSRKRGCGAWMGEQTKIHPKTGEGSVKDLWDPQNEEALAQERITPLSGYCIQHHCLKGPNDAKLALAPSYAEMACNLRNHDDWQEC